jgi:hypothetical protein
MPRLRTHWRLSAVLSPEFAQATITGLLKRSRGLVSYPEELETQPVRCGALGARRCDDSRQRTGVVENGRRIGSCFANLPSLC